MGYSFCLIGICFVMNLFGLTSVNAQSVANKFRFPLDNYHVGCNVYWGTCNIPNKRHLGEDATANAGTAVYAIANGIVKEAKFHNGYGGTYIIEHLLPSGERIISLYGHLNLNSFVKSAQQSVVIGEYLGTVGTTSQNGGWPEHLHLAIHKGKYESMTDDECGWVYAGYTGCITGNKSVKNDWYSPSTFINGHIGDNPQAENEVNTTAYANSGHLAWLPLGVACKDATKWIDIDTGVVVADKSNQSVSGDVVCENYGIIHPDCSL